jgi:predicted RNase H-like HicB family nuclease
MRSKRRPFEYRIVLRYSEEDEGYIAVVPEPEAVLPGERQQRLLEAVEEAASVWLESAKANKIKIPSSRQSNPSVGGTLTDAP